MHDGSNWYAYCGNNPLTRTDPTGNLWQDSPTNHTAEGEGHGQIMEAMGNIGDAGWSGDSMQAQLDQQMQQNHAAQQASAQLEAMLLTGVNFIGSFTIGGGSGGYGGTINTVISFGIPAGDISLGPFHFEGGFGVAIQIPGWGAKNFAYEVYSTEAAGIGIGLGMSASPSLSSISVGRGNLDGFNGYCLYGGIYAQPFTSIEYAHSPNGNYDGIQIGTPHSGLDFGIYGGISNTQSLFGLGPTH